MIPDDFEIDDLETWWELDLTDKIQVVKSTVSVPEVASLLLGNEYTEGDKIPSPWNPGERTPSCHLYDDHFFDFSTGRGGDLFDLMQALNPEYQQLGDIVKAMHKGALSVGKEYGEVEAQKPRTVQDFSDQLPTNTIATDSVLKIEPAYGIRHDEQSNVLVPHRDEDGVYGVKVRYRSGGKGSWAGSCFTHRLYDPLGWQPGHVPTQTLVVAEGESDCWALRHVLGVDVLALPAGVGTWKDHWLDDTKCYDRVYVCVDNDRAGRDARDKLRGKFGWDRTDLLEVPQLYTDAREAIAAGWHPALSF